MAPAPDYSNLEDYNLNLYNRWIENLVKLKLPETDLKLSDNLVGVLSAYPEAILIGSFLWTEIQKLRVPEEWKKIMDFEEELLQDIKPTMLGLSMMVMPNVKSKTNFIGFPWLCEREYLLQDNHFKKGEYINVLVTGGGNLCINNLIIELLNALYAEKDIQLFADREIFQYCDNGFSRVKLFPFNNQSFDNLDWIIGRPGTGILTDAIRYKKPVLMLTESDNEEMNHNKFVFESNSLGFDLNRYYKQGRIDKTNLLALIHDQEAYNKYKSFNEKQEIGGYKGIVSFVLDKLYKQ